MDQSMPSSPNRPRTPASSQVVAIQVRQFLDSWHLRFASSSLGKIWPRSKVVKTALDLLALNGAQLAPDQISRMSEMEEEFMISELVDSMPPEFREKFETVALQLQVVVNTAVLIRKAAENPEPKEALAGVFDESEGDTMAQQVLKKSVVGASKEISNLLRCQNSWVGNMEGRLRRLMMAQETAEKAASQLLAVESQLERFHGSTKSKASKMLMNMCNQNSQALLGSVFSGWNSHTVKAKAEKTIRDKFEKEIEAAERSLMEYKMAKMETTRNLLNRNAQGEQMALMATVVNSWYQQIRFEKDEKERLEQEKALAGKLGEFNQSQMEGAKKVLARMSGDQDAACVKLAMQAWQKFSEEYKKDKESEDALRKVEQEMQKMMQRNKANASSVLDRMNAATESGLLELSWQGWTAALQEAKAEAEIAKALASQQDKFKSFKLRQGTAAKNAQTRVNDQMNALLMTKILCGWQIETRCNHIDKYYNSKLESKRKQLHSVHGLFKSFAQQLDEGLGKIEQEEIPSGRMLNNHSRHHSHRSKSGLSKSEGQVSLPNIHQKYQRGVVA